MFVNILNAWNQSDCLLNKIRSHIPFYANYLSIWLSFNNHLYDAAVKDSLRLSIHAETPFKLFREKKNEMPGSIIKCRFFSKRKVASSARLGHIETRKMYGETGIGHMWLKWSRPKFIVTYKMWAFHLNITHNFLVNDRTIGSHGQFNSAEKFM